MKFSAVLNRHGGTLRTTDIDAFCQTATEIFARHGHQLTCTPVEGDRLIEALETAARAPETDVLLAGGGDGTISAAAAIAYRAEVPLAVLPAGTMNLFARSLKVPLDLGAAVTALASGSLGQADIATANGRPFVHQFAVGIHPRLVRIREEQQGYNSRLGKMAASMRAVSSAIVRPPNFQVELLTPRGKERRSVSGLTVSNNPLGAGHLPHADRLDTGLLGVYVAKPMGSGAMARLLVEVMLGSWHADPMVSEREVRQVTLRFPRRKRSAQAVIDGELVELEAEVDLTIHPGALKVIIPGEPGADER